MPAYGSQKGTAAARKNTVAMQKSLQSVNSRSGSRQEVPPHPTSQPGRPAPSPAQQKNVEQLKNDLVAIKQGSEVTPEQKQALKDDLMSMAQGATKPDPALVEQLANSLSAAMADGQLTLAEKARLAADVEAVLNSANISPAQVQKAITDAQAILTASGITRAQVQTVVSDLQAIAAEAQNNPPARGKRGARAIRGSGS